MINHKHKCIFIHIPGTGGTSIETALTGRDWWSVESTTKHILASTAKEIYSEYWDDYFKFSFVRNPWSRMVSLLRHGGFYGLHLMPEREQLDVSGYIKDYHPVEIDERSASAEYSGSYLDNAVYLNILNESLDFIGRFENLEQDFNFICDKIGAGDVSLPHVERSKHTNHKHYIEYYDNKTRELVRELYRKDIERFGYEFGK